MIHPAEDSRLETEVSYSQLSIPRLVEVPPSLKPLGCFILRTTFQIRSHLPSARTAQTLYHILHGYVIWSSPCQVVWSHHTVRSLPCCC